MARNNAAHYWQYVRYDVKIKPQLISGFQYDIHTHCLIPTENLQVHLSSHNMTHNILVVPYVLRRKNSLELIQSIRIYHLNN